MIVTGDRINGTIPAVLEALNKRDEDFIASLARRQAEAGADYIDVNVGGVKDERESMVWAVEVVLRSTGARLSLDSSDPGVLAAALDLPLGDRPFLNSVNGDPASLSLVLPLAAEHSCRVVSLAMDHTGIPSASTERLKVCMRIREAAEEAGVPESSLYFDPLVLPVGVDHAQGRITLDTLAMITREIPGACTIMGLSNVSFGLPRRSLLNRAMLTGAVCLGLDACLLDPEDAALTAALLAAESVSGRDPHCRGFLRAYRDGRLGPGGGQEGGASHCQEAG